MHLPVRVSDHFHSLADTSGAHRAWFFLFYYLPSPLHYHSLDCGVIHSFLVYCGHDCFPLWFVVIIPLVHCFYYFWESINFENLASDWESVWQMSFSYWDKLDLHTYPILLLLYLIHSWWLWNCDLLNVTRFIYMHCFNNLFPHSAFLFVCCISKRPSHCFFLLDRKMNQILFSLVVKANLIDLFDSSWNLYLE